MKDNLLNAAFILRKRLNWESLDAGILLWRQNIAAVLAAVAVPCLITAVLLRRLFPDMLWISWTALWWLKPLYDRIIIHIIGTRFFQTPSGSNQTLPVISIFRGIMPDLTWRRFSIMRSARLPVRILEGSRGTEIRRRFRALSRGGLDFGALLTAASLTIEILLIPAEGIFFLTLLSIINPAYFEIFSANIPLIEQLLFTAFCINIICVEGLYAAMGFGLYINSRIEVEGWDIQFLFKSFASARKGAGERVKPTAIIALITFSLLFSPQVMQADTAPQKMELTDEVPAHSLDKILEAEEFGGTREQWAIRLKPTPEEGPEFDLPRLEPRWELIRNIFGYTLLAVIVSALIVLIIYLTGVLRRRGLLNSPPEIENETTVKSALNTEFSPQDALKTAEEHLTAHNLREAWALSIQTALYIASLGTGYEYHPQSTELEILKWVSSREIHEAEQFTASVHNWLKVAYAGAPPVQEECEECINWSRRSLSRIKKERSA